MKEIMTTKEKANELIDKMEMIVQAWESNQCALIAVELLIEFDAPRNKYWKEVKKEIENTLQ